MDAIIYTTNTGSTGQYAKLLAQETGLPAYSLAEAKKRVFAGAEVVYLGWIMAGSVKGCAGAAKRYQVCAVCGVGMGQTGTQTDSVRKKSEIPANIPLFTLQGNFNVKKLHGIYRFMMEIMVKTVSKSLATKKDRTPEENDMLDLGGIEVVFDVYSRLDTVIVPQKAVKKLDGRNYVNLLVDGVKIELDV